MGILFVVLILPQSYSFGIHGPKPWTLEQELSRPQDTHLLYAMGLLQGGGFKYFQTHTIKRRMCQKSLFSFFHSYELVNLFEKSLSCLMCQQKYIWSMADNLDFDLPRILVNISVQSDKINFYWTWDMGMVDNFIIDFRSWTNIPLLPVKHCIDWTDWNCTLMTPCNIAIIQAVNFMGQCWEECRLCNV